MKFFDFLSSLDDFEKFLLQIVATIVILAIFFITIWISPVILLLIPLGWLVSLIWRYNKWKKNA